MQSEAIPREQSWHNGPLWALCSAKLAAVRPSNRAVGPTLASLSWENKRQASRHHDCSPLASIFPSVSVYTRGQTFPAPSHLRFRGERPAQRFIRHDSPSPARRWIPTAVVSAISDPPETVPFQAAIRRVGASPAGVLPHDSHQRCQALQSRTGLRWAETSGILREHNTGHRSASTIKYCNIRSDDTWRERRQAASATDRVACSATRPAGQ